MKKKVLLVLGIIILGISVLDKGTMQSEKF